MKKNIMIISIVLIGLVLVFNANSWAGRDKGGPQQKWNKSSKQFYKPDDGRRGAPAIQGHRPLPQPAPKFNKPNPRRAPQRFAPKHRNWLHRPYYRPFAPKWHIWQHRHGGVNNPYYGKTERYYAPEDAFSASAVISNTGFLVSVGVSAMH